MKIIKKIMAILSSTILFFSGMIITSCSIFGQNTTSSSSTSSSSTSSSSSSSSSEEHNHNYLKEEVSATCESGGYTIFTCKECNHSYKENVVEALGHNYGDLLQEKLASCEENGEVAHYHCSRCDKNFDKDKNEIESIVIFSLGHDYGELITKVDATCSKEGNVAHYHCFRCNKNFDENKKELENVVIKTVDHKYGEWVMGKQPTCQQEGHLSYYECEVCKGKFDYQYNELKDIVLPTLDHNYGSLVLGKEAKCYEEGIINHYECSMCYKIFDENYNLVSSKIIPMLPHTPMTVLGSEATCDRNGYTDGQSCSICNAPVVPQQEIPALGHNYKDVVTEPTKETQGYTTHTCDRCQDSYVDNYVNLQDICEHKETITKTLVAPTCLEGGKDVEVCVNCDKELSQIDTDPLEHEYVKEIVLPTMYDQGKTTDTCKHCGDSIINWYVEDLAHLNYYVNDENQNVLELSSQYETPILVYYLFELNNYTYEGTQVSTNEIDVLIIKDKITAIGLVGFMNRFSNLKKVVFGESIQEIGDMAFYDCTLLEEYHFLGDEPKVSDLSLQINGSTTAKVYVDTTKNGFDSLYFNGLTVQNNLIPARGNIDMPVNEYSMKATKKLIEIINYNIDKAKEQNQLDLLLFPYEVDIFKYKYIKDFTLDLVKDCETEEEKINKIYNYICQNIKYVDSKVDNSPYDVLTEKEAVCAGYVILMHDMLSSIDVVSFYTRGSTLLGNNLITKSIIENWGSFGSSAHAWLSVYKSNGEISFYDPTWGVSNLEAYRNMNEEEISAHVVTTEIEGLNIVIDDFSYCMYGGTIQFLHTDGYIYSCNQGQLTMMTEMAAVNYVVSFHMSPRDPSTNAVNVDEINQPIGTMRVNGLEIIGLDLNNLISITYARCDGRIINLSNLYAFINLENKYYNKNIELQYDYFILENDCIYFKNNDDTLSLVKYIGNSKDVIVPSAVQGMNVTNIVGRAFEYNSYIENVTISEGIKTIRIESFYHNLNLKTISLPSSLGEFENLTTGNPIYNPFDTCPNLEMIDVSGENPLYQSIDGNLYSKNGEILYAYASNNPVKFEFTENIKQIAHLAFVHSNIEEITIPANVEIGNKAFYYSTKLKKVVIEDGIKEIGWDAFANCQSLQEVRLPNTLESINESMFAYTYSLYQLTIPESVKEIKSNAFISSGIVSITLPSELESIGNSAFAFIDNLKEIINLSSLNIEIGSYDYGQIALNAEYIIKDASLTKYKEVDGYVLIDNVLVGYKKATETLVLPELIDGKEYQLSSQTFGFDYSYSVYSMTPHTYKFETPLYHDYLSVKKIVIEANIAELPDNCFVNFINLEEITVTKELVEIGKNVFSNSNLKTINFVGTQEEYDNHSLKYFYDQYTVNIIEE